MMQRRGSEVVHGKANQTLEQGCQTPAFVLQVLDISLLQLT